MSESYLKTLVLGPKCWRPKGLASGIMVREELAKAVLIRRRV